MSFSQGLRCPFYLWFLSEIILGSNLQPPCVRSCREEGEWSRKGAKGVANIKGSQCCVIRIESPLPRGRSHGAAITKVGSFDSFLTDQ